MFQIFHPDLLLRNLTYNIFFLVSIALILMCPSHLYAQPEHTSIKAELVENELIFTKAPFKQCHASSLVELSDSTIMAVWFGGTYERHPDVCIWGSKRSKTGWSSPVLMADGIISNTLRYPCWNPVLFKNRKGILYLFYKIGPSPREWWGMYKKSYDEGRTWSDPVTLPEGIIGPVKNKPVYIPGGRIISPSSIETGNSWNVHMEISDDDGNSWSKVPLDTTTGFKIIQPALLLQNNGNVLALMRSDQNAIVQSISKDNGNSWSKPVKSDLLNPNSGIDAVTLTNGSYLLVYNPTVSKKDWSAGRNKLFVAVSYNGENWYDVYKLEDKTSGEFSYPAIIQASDGLVHISYTYDRKSIRHVVLKIQ